MLNHWNETPTKEERDSTDKYQWGPGLWDTAPKFLSQGHRMLFVFLIMNYQMLTSPGLRKATLMSREGWVAKIRLPDQETKSDRRNQEHLMWDPVHVSDARRSQTNQNIGFWSREKFIAESLKETGGSWPKKPQVPWRAWPGIFKCQVWDRAGSRVGCVDQLMHYSPTGWWELAGWCPRG